MASYFLMENMSNAPQNRYGWKNADEAYDDIEERLQKPNQRIADLQEVVSTADLLFPDQQERFLELWRQLRSRLVFLKLLPEEEAEEELIEDFRFRHLVGRWTLGLDEEAKAKPEEPETSEDTTSEGRTHHVVLAKAEARKYPTKPREPSQLVPVLLVLLSTATGALIAKVLMSKPSFEGSAREDRVSLLQPYFDGEREWPLQNLGNLNPSPIVISASTVTGPPPEISEADLAAMRDPFEQPAPTSPIFGPPQHPSPPVGDEVPLLDDQGQEMQIGRDPFESMNELADDLAAALDETGGLIDQLIEAETLIGELLDEEPRDDEPLDETEAGDELEVAVADGEGIATGHPEGTFQPDPVINRAGQSDPEAETTPEPQPESTEAEPVDDVSGDEMMTLDGEPMLWDPGDEFEEPEPEPEPLSLSDLYTQVKDLLNPGNLDEQAARDLHQQWFFAPIGTPEQMRQRSQGMRQAREIQAVHSLGRLQNDDLAVRIASVVLSIRGRNGDPLEREEREGLLEEIQDEGSIEPNDSFDAAQQAYENAFSLPVGNPQRNDQMAQARERMDFLLIRDLVRRLPVAD